MKPVTNYTIMADPARPKDSVIVTDGNGKRTRIHIEDADPEHRFTTHRLAAGWFANLPAGFDPNEVK